MKLVVASLLAVPAFSSVCSDLVSSFEGVFLDMHDGDQKKIASGTSSTIKMTPASDDEKWEVDAKLGKSCQASIDFNVPGKPSPPPVPLQGAFYPIYTQGGKRKAVLEFTDPSGTLKPPLYPLNQWVSATASDDDFNCPVPKRFSAVYADMHDGDEKVVTIKGHRLTIRSNNATETWTVKSRLSRKSCSAVIDFNVAGKPSPPPVNLTAQLWFGSSIPPSPDGFSGLKTIWEFTDPSGTIAEEGVPLNHWVELPGHSTTTAPPYVPPVAKGKCCYGFPGSDNWEGCQSATACPANPSCESPELCEGICRGTWCNTESELIV